MAIAVRCECGKKFSAPEKLAGKRVKCPGCGGPIAIPAAGGGDRDPPKGDIQWDKLAQMEQQAPSSLRQVEPGDEGAQAARPSGAADSKTPDDAEATKAARKRAIARWSKIAIAAVVAVAILIYLLTFGAVQSISVEQSERGLMQRINDDLRTSPPRIGIAANGQSITVAARVDGFQFTNNGPSGEVPKVLRFEARIVKREDAKPLGTAEGKIGTRNRTYDIHIQTSAGESRQLSGTLEN
jgi:hypothetical protein